MTHLLSGPRPAAVAAATLIAVSSLSLGAASGSVRADEACTATIDAVTIGDNVVVPANASCSLNGTTVEGNVLIGPGATLTATGVRVDGNIQDDNGGAGHVAVTGSEVIGSIQLEQGTQAAIVDTHIDGDLQWESNTGPLEARGNTIGGNLQANQNTGGVAIDDNTIDGNLQCQSNQPPPTGSNNVVHGDREGQCTDMQPTEGPDTGPVGPDGRVCFGVVGAAGDAAIVNVTPVLASNPGNGQLVSSDVASPPVASNVNFVPGSVDPNVAVATIGSDGQVCYVNSGHASVHVIADHLGTIGAAAYQPASNSGAPVRTLDTRS